MLILKINTHPLKMDELVNFYRKKIETNTIFAIRFCSFILKCAKIQKRIAALQFFRFVLIQKKKLNSNTRFSKYCLNSHFFYFIDKKTLLDFSKKNKLLSKTYIKAN